jgi:phosphinothricin acetyltransferase
MTPTIRLATEADLPAIVQIYNEAIPGRMATADTAPVMVEERLEWFRQHDPSVHPIFVCEEAGRIIGWTSLSAFYGRPAYQKTVEVSTYVTTRRHRAGVGTALREHVLSACDRYGIKTVLSFVFAHNVPSIRLNEKFGFAKWGHLPRVAELDGIERDLVIMGKRLAERKSNKAPRGRAAPQRPRTVGELRGGRQR